MVGKEIHKLALEQSHQLMPKKEKHFASSEAILFILHHHLYNTPYLILYFAFHHIKIIYFLPAILHHKRREKGKERKENIELINLVKK